MSKRPGFYLTSWEPEGDGEICHLMEREGGDGGQDVISATFSRYPAPFGEEMAANALKFALMAETTGLVGPKDLEDEPDSQAA
jgi:hypothetical protein